MTKIANYTVKKPVANLDSWIGSDGYNSAKTTKNFTAQDVADYVKSNLTPIDGGIQKITEIDIDVLDTDIATTVNAMSPPYIVAPYELVHFVVGGRVYILKVVDTTIGLDQTSLTNEDFIILPVNTGNGIVSIVLHNTDGIYKVYRITYTDGSHFDYTVTDGENGTPGAKGDTGNDGADADMTRTSTNSITMAVNAPYEYITVTFPASSNLGWIVGTRVRLTNSQANYMEGIILAVTSTSIDVNIDYVVGSGTFALWNISVTGDKGSVGVYPDLVAEIYSNEIHDFNGNGSNQVIGSSATGVTYSMYFKKVGNNVFVTWTFLNESGSSIGTSTALVTMSNSAYFKKASTACQLTGVTSAGSVIYNYGSTLGTDGTVKLSSSLANGISITIYGRYTVNTP